MVLEQGNGYTAEGGDMTAHAERLLATRASKRFPPAVLASHTMYIGRAMCDVCRCGTGAASAVWFLARANTA